jgi:hypothetical protein
MRQIKVSGTRNDDGCWSVEASELSLRSLAGRIWQARRRFLCQPRNQHANAAHLLALLRPRRERPRRRRATEQRDELAPIHSMTRRLEVDDEVELHRLLHWQVGRLGGSAVRLTRCYAPGPVTVEISISNPCPLPAAWRAWVSPSWVSRRPSPQ